MPKKIKTIKAIKGKLIIELNTPSGLDHFTEQCIYNKQGRETQQLLSAVKFWQYLRNKTFDTSKLIPYSDLETFRAFMNRVSNPLSILGSKLNGGRFNIGTPQIQQEGIFPDVKPSACLYAAASIDCAFAESRIHDLKNVKFVKVSPKNKIKLWDLDKILIEIDIDWPNTNIKNEIDAQALGDMWIYQKIPTFSQLISHRLRQLGGDGIVYKSSRVAGNTHNDIYAFFSPNWHKDDVTDLYDATVL